MSAESLRIVVTTDPAGVAVVAPHGELDIATAEHLRDLLRRILVEHPKVVLDLAGVTFCDCSGLRVLKDAGRSAELTGADLRLRALSHPVARVVTATRSERFFTIEPPPIA